MKRNDTAHAVLDLVDILLFCGAVLLYFKLFG